MLLLSLLAVVAVVCSCYIVVDVVAWCFSGWAGIDSTHSSVITGLDWNDWNHKICAHKNHQIRSSACVNRNTGFYRHEQDSY